MNQIKKYPLNKLGYHFVNEKYLPAGADEYYLRNLQNRSGINYRQLTAYEIEVLVRNRNSSDNWNNLLVSDAFNPELVKNCKFYGLVRIGKLEAFFLEISELKVPVGLYNSTIISCDFGDNVVIDNVNYISHYIVGNEVMIINVNEILTTPFAKFGNGILKEGESEDIRIWMELCNENAGRKVIPFNGMLPGDARLWSKYRDNELLLEKFKAFTEKKFDTKHGYYGKIGDRTVIKNCSIIKDVWIGSDAYLKGANKLKNLTIESSELAKSQIGEGCELVNGIIGLGCRIFYGVKAVRFIMASNSQLKYGARLINSYLGNNATISCCEVLNSLIFPGHEQHHNNSFLCASTIMGQSNIAAGATIGSNHNSRSADGELIAGRGFWPGLCVSLKHSTMFASFTIVAKGDYSSELNIKFPFSLVSQSTSKDTLMVMPCYWFLYNMYALARNAWKYNDRDRRPDVQQRIEFDYLAPDTINEMFEALGLLEIYTGLAWYKKSGLKVTDSKAQIQGKKLLLNPDTDFSALEITAHDIENSKRKVVVLKAREAYHCYRSMITYYGALSVIELLDADKIPFPTHALPKNLTRQQWVNLGGQLIPQSRVDLLIKKITSDKINNWDQVHDFYTEEGNSYDEKKMIHALACVKELKGFDLSTSKTEEKTALLDECLSIRTWMMNGIEKSRQKDHDNLFRKMMYDSQQEMDTVLGSFEDNSFINQEKADFKVFEMHLKKLKKQITV